MKRLKATLLSFAFILLFLGLIFIGELYLNAQQTETLALIIFILSSILFLYGLIQIIMGDSRFKLLKGRVNGFIIMSSAAIFFIGFMFISSFNMGLYGAFQKEFTPMEKLAMYKTLNISLKEKNTYNMEIDSYVSGLNKEKINFISIFYDDEIDLEHIDKIKDTIDLAEDLTENVFGDFKKEPLKLIFYGEEEKFKIDEFNSDLVQAYFDGENIHIKKFSNHQSLEEVEENFIHEYSHYAYDLFLLENDIFTSLPTWFNEGVAEYTVLYKGDRDYDLQYLENPVKLTSLETTSAFSQALEKGQDPEKFYNPYMYSYYMIDSLVEEKGIDFIKDIILRSKDIGFYQAFEEIVGVGVEEYQDINLVEYINNKANKN